MAQKNGKALLDRLDAFIIMHNWTLATLDEQKEASTQAEQSFEKLMEAKSKQKEWYEEQLIDERKLAEEIQSWMWQELARMEELHEKELKILQTNMGLIQDPFN